MRCVLRLCVLLIAVAPTTYAYQGIVVSSPVPTVQPVGTPFLPIPTSSITVQAPEAVTVSMTTVPAATTAGSYLVATQPATTYIATPTATTYYHPQTTTYYTTNAATIYAAPTLTYIAPAETYYTPIQTYYAPARTYYAPARSLWPFRMFPRQTAAYYPTTAYVAASY